MITSDEMKKQVVNVVAPSATNSTSVAAEDLPLKCIKFNKSTEGHIELLWTFCRAHYLEVEGRKKREEIVFADLGDFGSEDSFEKFQKKYQNHEDINFFSVHAVAGFYLFFSPDSQDPIGILFLHPNTEDGYIGASIGFLQKCLTADRHHYGSRAAKEAIKYIIPYIGSELPFFKKDSTGGKLISCTFKGICADVDIRNIASLGLNFKMGMQVFDYKQMLNDGKISHGLFFSHSGLKSKETKSPNFIPSVECVIPDKAEIFPKIQEIAKSISDAKDSTVRSINIGRLQKLLLPIFERHNGDYKAARSKTKLALAEILPSELNISDKLSPIDIVSEYFVGTDFSSINR